MHKTALAFKVLGHLKNTLVQKKNIVHLVDVCVGVYSIYLINPNNNQVKRLVYWEVLNLEIFTLALQFLFQRIIINNI